MDELDDRPWVKVEFYGLPPFWSAIGLRCPTCAATPGQRCRALKSGRTTDFHAARPNSIGFTGRDERGRQFCLRCQRWKFPVIHSCPGVPQMSTASATKRKD